MPTDYSGKSWDVKGVGLHYTPFSEKAPAIARVAASERDEKSRFRLPVAQVGLDLLDIDKVWGTGEDRAFFAAFFAKAPRGEEAPEAHFPDKIRS
jgi:hypothetical protein